jgi:hypothetical protein
MQGIAVSKVLVAKLMKQQCLKSIVKKRYRATTDFSHREYLEQILYHQ